MRLVAQRYSGNALSASRRGQEASPSPVYGAALLMRFGFTPIRGSNPRASARHGPLPGCPGEGARLVKRAGGGNPGGTRRRGLLSVIQFGEGAGGEDGQLLAPAALQVVDRV